MKLFLFAAKSLLAGAFFAIGAAAIVFWVLPKLYPYDTDEFLRNQISETEEKLGMSCQDIYVNALEFTESDIGEIINQGLKGNDWVAYIDDEQLEFIHTQVDRLWDCNIASLSAERLGEDWPNFDYLHKLFSSLRIYSTQYGSGPLTSNDLKPEALDSLRFDYQNVTSQSTRTR